MLRNTSNIRKKRRYKPAIINYSRIIPSTYQHRHIRDSCC